MSCDLDPAEVLAHLNSLGYYNISGNQLKDFMKDLKKLIKYDQIQRDIRRRMRAVSHTRDARMHSSPERSARTDNCEESNLSHKSRERPAPVQHLPYCPPPISTEQPIPQTQSEEEQELPQCNKNCACCRGGCQHTDGESEETYPDTRGESRSSSNRRPGTVRKENIPPRPASSFIRPNIRGNNLKSDPVALFHRYQKCWAQNPLPGEDPRSNLRWNIRQRMMGPQPSITKTTSVDKINRPPFQV